MLVLYASDNGVNYSKVLYYITFGVYFMAFQALVKSLVIPGCIAKIRHYNQYLIQDRGEGMPVRTVYNRKSETMYSTRFQTNSFVLLCAIINRNLFLLFHNSLHSFHARRFVIP